MNYRIVIRYPLEKKPMYYIQRRVLFFWVFETEYKSPFRRGCVIFDNLPDAEKYIKNKKYGY